MEIPASRLVVTKGPPLPLPTRDELPCAPVCGLTEEGLLVSAGDVDKLPGNISEADRATLRAAFANGARTLRVIPAPPPRMPPVPSGTFLRKGEIRKPPTFALLPEELELCAGGEGDEGIKP